MESSIPQHVRGQRLDQGDTKALAPDTMVRWKLNQAEDRTAHPVAAGQILSTSSSGSVAFQMNTDHLRLRSLCRVLAAAPNEHSFSPIR